MIANWVKRGRAHQGRQAGALHQAGLEDDRAFELSQHAWRIGGLVEQLQKQLDEALRYTPKGKQDAQDHEAYIRRIKRRLETERKRERKARGKSILFDRGGKRRHAPRKAKRAAAGAVTAKQFAAAMRARKMGA